MDEKEKIMELASKIKEFVREKYKKNLSLRFGLRPLWMYLLEIKEQQLRIYAYYCSKNLLLANLLYLPFTFIYDIKMLFKKKKEQKEQFYIPFGFTRISFFNILNYKKIILPNMVEIIKEESLERIIAHEMAHAIGFDEKDACIFTEEYEKKYGKFFKPRATK